MSGKRPSAAGGGPDSRFLHDLETLSNALDPKTRRPAPKSSDKKPSSSSSFWSSWKPLKALSNISGGKRRFDCRFTLRVHSIDGLPPSLADAALAVHWKRTSDPASAATRPARVLHSVADFEETLAYRCPVYATRGSGPNKAAKYQPREFLIWVSVVGGRAAADLGRHMVDLTRLLPLALKDLDDEDKRSGQWGTSFRLSGKARGATLIVSFGFSVVVDGSSSGTEKKVVEFPNRKTSRMDRSRSVEDVKVLHEVLSSVRSEASSLANAARELEYRKPDDGQVGTFEGDSKAEFMDVPVESPDSNPCTLSEPAKGNGEEDCVEPPVKGNEETDCDEPPVTGIEEKDSDEPLEFMVIEQGIEVTIEDRICETGSEKADLDGVDNGCGIVIQNEPSTKPDELVEELSCHDDDCRENSLSPGDVVDLDSAFDGLSILEMEGVESPRTEAKTYEEERFSEFKSNCKPGSMMSRSLSMDDVTAESVASEFLSMLGIEHSPFKLSSDSDPESPRERLWKQFEKDSLSTGEALFGLDTGVGNESGWGDFSEDLDLSSIVHEAEEEFRREAQDVDSKSRAKLLEDEETEALMREWGLNEKAFHRSPPGSRSGFGSPIDLPPEEHLDLPPLGEGLGPFLKTKDGGFVRSMNPSLFMNAKNNGSLIMQVSSPVVVPAEMGSDIMDILQGLASVGIEKLSGQAKKIMPLEDISGKTMRQAAWEAAPALEPYERQGIFQHREHDADSGIGHNFSGRKKKCKGRNLASSGGGEMGSEYVSLEDLAPLAMDKIETLSIEGLRIQSGMSDEEAPSNISPQSLGDISALEGKEAKNSRSLGLDGAAGLQLLDVQDNEGDIDGLMGLSITLDEWMRLDSGIIDEDQISDHTSKILAAHHACSTDFIRGRKEDKGGGKRSGKRWGLLGNNFTVALMVQLRDPLRDYEPVGTPMLALIQVERVFLPPKPKIYNTVSENGNSEQDDEPETKIELAGKEEKKEEEDAIPQFKIIEAHVAGLKTEPRKKKVWGNPMQQQSGSRWLLATGMGKSNKHPFMKSKAVVKPSQVTTKVQPGDTLWSISSTTNGPGTKWKELAALNPHVRNPNVILPNQTVWRH